MTIRRVLLAAVGSLGLIGAASAAPVTGQISIGGFAQAVGAAGMGAATGIDFASGAGEVIAGTSGGLYSFGSGNGSFAALGTCASSNGSCGTIMDLASFATASPTTGFLTLNTGGPAVSFDLSSLTNLSHSSDASGGSVTFEATGTINFAGYDPTPGAFLLTAQGNNVVSFSSTALVTGATPAPEPASIALLGGALAGLGFVRRGRR